MEKATELLSVVPVLPSADVARDVKWYTEKLGFKIYFADKMYAMIYRENICIHLQWHADTPNDPLLGGSVIRISVNNIKPIFEEFVKSGIVKPGKLIENTPWKTTEFGFLDLNKNAIFIMEDIT